MKGFRPSETKACRTWLSMGSFSPAISATREELPAAASASLPQPMKPFVVFDASDPAIVATNARDLAILDYVDAAHVSAASIAPSNRIMAHGAAALLQKSAPNREAGIVIVEEWQHLAHRGAIEKVGIDAVQAHGIAAALYRRRAGRRSGRD